MHVTRYVVAGRYNLIVAEHTPFVDGIPASARLRPNADPRVALLEDNARFDPPQPIHSIVVPPTDDLRSVRPLVNSAVRAFCAANSRAPCDLNHEFILIESGDPSQSVEYSGFAQNDSLAARFVLDSALSLDRIFAPIRNALTHCVLPNLINIICEFF